MAFSIGYNILAAVMALKAPSEKSVLKGLFYDLKESKSARIYTAIMLMRRNSLVLFLIFGQSFSAVFRLMILLKIQMIYMPIIIALKPFKKAADNIIDIVNEIFFLVLLSTLVFYNKKDHWDDSIKQVYLNIIMFNSLIILILILVATV